MIYTDSEILNIMKYLDSVDDIKFSWPGDYDTLVGNNDITMLDYIENQYNELAILDDIKFIFRSVFVSLFKDCLNDNDKLNNIPSIFFKIINVIFYETFNLTVDDILNVGEIDKTSIDYRYQFLHFLIFLHNDIPLMKDINEFINDNKYGLYIQHLSKDQIENIFSKFNSLIPIDNERINKI